MKEKNNENNTEFDNNLKNEPFLKINETHFKLV